MNYSVINRSQLEGAYRLDAEYYQPEYLDLISKFKSQKLKLLGEISEVVYGTTPHGGIFEKKGIPFIRSQNFSNILIDTSDLVFCTKEFYQRNKKSAIRPGDVLFAAVGATIGEVAVVQDDIKEGNINQNVARVRITDESVNSYFVGFFFASKPGQLQIERLITGNAQPYLNSEQIKAFFIPVLKKEQQDKIAIYFQKIQDQIKISQNLYSQAEDLLLEELGLKDFKPKDELSCIVNLSEIKSAHRADAEYFQPKYEKLISKIKNRNAKELGKLAKRVKTKIKPKSEEIYRYIEISDISIGSGDVNFNEIIGKELPANARIPIKGGELIVSKVRPTRGAISIIPNDFSDKFICSGAFSVFQTPDIPKEYLFLVLGSLVGKLQFEKPTTGTSYPTITDEDVENILVPILPKPTQQKIADLVQKSHEACAKAKQLLAQAKSKVEDLIEVKS